MPRAVVDLVAARPIHLAIVEGIKSMTGGEGPWIQSKRASRMGVPATSIRFKSRVPSPAASANPRMLFAAIRRRRPSPSQRRPLQA